MSDSYTPPFTMTEEITNLVIEIGEQVGAVVTYDAVTFMLEVIRDALRAVVESQNKLTEVGANVGENVGVNVGENVGTNVEKIVALLRQDNRLTARTLAATLNLTDRQVERILAKLKAEGKLVRHGASKNGHWEVLEEYE